jgi:hypothetical protein
MKKIGQTAFFYASKTNPYILLFMTVEFLIVILVFIPFLTSLLLKCAIIFCCVAVFSISCTLINTIKNIGRPLIQISNFDVVFEGKKIKWCEISKITLENERKGEALELYLKIEWGNTPYSINLKYMNDCERRLLLNEIEKYKSISYKGCSYNGNYVLWERISMILGLLMLQVVYALIFNDLFFNASILGC